MRCHFDHKVVAADPGGEREDKSPQDSRESGKVRFPIMLGPST